MQLSDIDSLFSRAAIEALNHNRAKTFLKGRGLLPSTIAAFGGGYVSVDLWEVPKDSEPSYHELVASGLFRYRRKADGAPEGTSFPSWTLRSTLADTIAIPSKDIEGRIRTWRGRHVDPTTPVWEVEGSEWDLHEARDGHDPDQRYRYLKRNRAEVLLTELGPQNVPVEDEGYPLLPSPQALDPRHEGPLWIVESTTDCLALSQCGAAAIATSGCLPGHAEVDLVLQFIRLRKPTEILICFDADPKKYEKAEAEARQTIPLGRGQRGAMQLVARLAARDALVGRRCRIVPLNKEDGTKIDLSDTVRDWMPSFPEETIPADDSEEAIQEAMLTDASAFESFEAEARKVLSKKLKELQETKIDPINFGIQLIQVANPKDEDLPGAVDDVSLYAWAAADEELWESAIWARLEKTFKLKPRKGPGRGIQKRASEARKDLPKSPIPDDFETVELNPKDGTLKATFANLAALMRTHADFETLKYNELESRPYVGGNQVDDYWLAEVRCSLERVHKGVFSSGMISEVMRYVSMLPGRRFHPVRDYLQKLPAHTGGDGILDEVVDLLGIDDAEHARWAAVALRRWLIAAVRRVMEPGIKADEVLILKGPQGCRKSTFLRTLAGEWFSDTSLDIRNKDAYQMLGGVWIYELAEFDQQMYGADAAKMKAFVSSSVDNFRAPYARAPERHPRSMLFAGTTNADEFLKDPTGDRRYWVVRVGPSDSQTAKNFKIDTDRLVRLRNSLWAWAYARALAGEQHHLTPEECLMQEDVNIEHRQQDPLEIKIDDALFLIERGMMGDDMAMKNLNEVEAALCKELELPAPGPLTEIAQSFLLDVAFGKTILKNYDLAKVNVIMESRGWKKDRLQRQGVRKMMYIRKAANAKALKVVG